MSTTAVSAAMTLTTATMPWRTSATEFLRRRRRSRASRTGNEGMLLNHGHRLADRALDIAQEGAFFAIAE